MNEELQKVLAELLSKANNGIDAAGGFLVSEIPEVIYQLLMWHSVKSIFYCVFFIVLAIASYRKVNHCFSKAKVSDNNSGEWNVAAFILICFTFLFSCCSISDLLNAVQIWVAPKVWLVEYAARLTSNN